MKVSSALNTLVSGEKPDFRGLFKGLVVLLCAEVVRQGVPDHGAVHSECSASNIDHSSGKQLSVFCRERVRTQSGEHDNRHCGLALHRRSESQ